MTRPPVDFGVFPRLVEEIEVSFTHKLAAPALTVALTGRRHRSSNE